MLFQIPLARMGERVRTEFGDEGTVRFCGTTHFRPGEWVGVELDRPKGKNDGCVQGVRYFECDECHGLFTRAENLQPLLLMLRHALAASLTLASGP